ncbi:MAG TPA: hypothetical protein VK978_00520 [Candidatus Saccharimonadales bacterium]|nr:hypothetical protein [Candidatus Saccharimonadales bacterium]
MRALILFTQDSVDKGQADPARLKELLEMNSTQDLTVDTAVYDDLSYFLTPDTQRIDVHSTGRQLDEYDVVYLRRIKENIAQAIAVGKYCKAKRIGVFDAEIAIRPGSMGKLTQYVGLSLAGLPFPPTVYASSHTVLRKALSASSLEYPLILKSVSGSRGSDNYLISTREELEARLQAQPDVHFLIQSYIPNTADYRVWVCGDVVGPILYRSRSGGHLNNTSQGGSAILVGPETLPEKVLADCRAAAQLFVRDVAGVDVVFENDDTKSQHYFFEVNRAPQIEGTPYEDVKAAALAAYMAGLARSTQ